MGMTLKFNAGLFEAQLMQTGERAIKGMSDHMRKVAIRIRDLARSYAPVKSGLLEDSIDYETIRVNRRNTYVVYIDADAARRGDRDGVLGDYAWIMHSQLRPHGNKGKALHLGLGSMAKAATGRKVGGRFLTRAIKDATKNLQAELVAEVRKVTGGSSLVNTQFRRERSDDE